MYTKKPVFLQSCSQIGLNLFVSTPPPLTIIHLTGEGAGWEVACTKKNRKCRVSVFAPCLFCLLLFRGSFAVASVLFFESGERLTNGLWPHNKTNFTPRKRVQTEPWEEQRAEAGVQELGEAAELRGQAGVRARRTCAAT